MSFANRLSNSLKALFQLGMREVSLYSRYQFGLRSGYLRWKTRRFPEMDPDSAGVYRLQPLVSLPERADLQKVLGECGQEQLIAEANEIVSGKVRLFGGDPVPLELIIQGELEHWTRYTQGDRLGDRGDVKWIWEPSRFGWAVVLGRAYYLSGDERFAQAFWEYTGNFMDANPPYLGPHWSSGQEVALRLMALVFAAQLFDHSPHSTPQRSSRLGWFIAASAERLPPTLVYARALNNNHLLSEALGLYTAALALPDHPQAQRWQKSGWQWFNRGLRSQIAEDGVYIQHSINYHRLMLQLALWAEALLVPKKEAFPQATQQCLVSATRWLLGFIDSISGQAPNLGPNDGAYILPLTVCPFADYRPVLQAASRLFLGQPAFSEGLWDEMSLWLAGATSGEKDRGQTPLPETASPVSYVIRHPSLPSWAYLRAARLSSRPGHADQLHLDLWWRGLNVAQDAGTYLYNAAPPWDNTLSCTAVHNTVTVNGLDQMRQAGKFLWLDWAQVRLIEQDRLPDGAPASLTVEHDGYRKLGIMHQRTLVASGADGWQVDDRLVPVGQSWLPKKLSLRGASLRQLAPRIEGKQSPAQLRLLQSLRSFAMTVSSRMKCAERSGEPCNYTLRLHWLLPNWEWQILTDSASLVDIRLASPYGVIVLQVMGQNSGLQIVRAGQLLHGSGQAAQIQGWVSPTYGVRRPALSFAVEARGNLPLSLVSRWSFPVVESS